MLDPAIPQSLTSLDPWKAFSKLRNGPAPTEGKTWKSEPITSGSKNHNVRPVVPRGNRPGNIELIWMQLHPLYELRHGASDEIQVDFGAKLLKSEFSNAPVWHLWQIPSSRSSG